VTPEAQRRGAICAALGVSACAGVLALSVCVRDPSPSRPVQSDRGDDAVHAFAASEPSLTKSPTWTALLDSDPSTDEIGIGNPSALAGLIVALGDADTNVRVDAVSDLGLSNDTQAESLLAITAMQDPAPAVRVEALYALESLRAESQLAAFRHALDDPDEDVRKAAISVLEELGDGSSTELGDFRTAR
jgi:HEAT repeat protein